MNQAVIADKLKEAAARYPASMRQQQFGDIPRISFNIGLSIPAAKPIKEAVICDIGGGIGLFSVGCAALGFGRVILVDDFGDAINREVGDSIFDLHRSYGVRIISRDVLADGLGELDEPLDVVTSFDSMEHWHHSPRKLFRELVSMLNPGGKFVLGVPNCVNLRKRISILFGRCKWSSMKDWYEPEIFRGHIREPDADDLAYIAKDLGLSRTQILGRNWLGSQSSKPLLRIATGMVDPLMSLRPSLCSNLYLVGEKGAAQASAGSEQIISAASTSAA